MTSLSEWAGRLNQALEEAQTALSAGETAEAERRAKATSALVRALRDIADLETYALERAPELDVDQIREELERRILRYVDEGRAPPIPR